MDTETRTAARAGRFRSLAALLSISAMFLSAVPTVASADDVNDMLEGPALAKTLRKGGNVIFMRHALTEKDYADQDGRAEMGNCNTQRMLSEQGFNQAREIGAAIQWQHIRVG